MSNHSLYILNSDYGADLMLVCSKRGCDWQQRLPEQATPSDLLALEFQHDLVKDVQPSVAEQLTMKDVLDTLQSPNTFYSLVGRAVEVTEKYTSDQREMAIYILTEVIKKGDK